jgi:hypothetical protein
MAIWQFILEQSKWNSKRNRRKIRRTQIFLFKPQLISSSNSYFPEEFVINETSRKELFTLLKIK